ncbi:MAG: class I SAM-dependent methyltransferase [Synechococcus sp.]
MAKSSLFDRVLAPLFGNVLLDLDEIARMRRQIDWEADCDRLADPTVTIPEYYSSQQFHGVPGGYLSMDAALTYDSITRYVMPPSEHWVRQGLLNRVQTHPRRIVDLGCGTGSTTLMLAKAYPDAEVVGVDLSPHMLAMAEYKTKASGCRNVQFRHRPAETTSFPEASVDLVTASLLFHETPVHISRAIVRECYRLLVTGGELLVLDGSQQTLSQTRWLMEIFEEPYIQDFATGNIEDWLADAGFGNVRAESLWGLNQVTRGVKRIVDERRENDCDWSEDYGSAGVAIA